MATKTTPSVIAPRLAEARQNVISARARFEAATKGSRGWMVAGDDLSFWQGAAASLAGLLASLEVAS